MSARFNVFVLLVSFLSLNAQMASASTCSAKSGTTSTSLLELYTSEGCSSCPPADEWISKLKSEKANVTPLAFHVDYWDYIGWADLFAKPEYSQRQRNNAAVGGSRFVYTPQFMLNGRDYRNWRDYNLAQQTKRHNGQAAKATLHLALDQGSDWRLKATANLAQGVAPDDLHVYVALYQNGLQSTVNAGENRGRTLKHDYVVRKLFGGYDISDVSQFSQEFKLSSKWHKRDAGAVVFVQDKASGAIIQSLALPFCKT